MKEFIKIWWLPVILLSAMVTFTIFAVHSAIIEDRKAEEKKVYHGYIIDKGYDPPTSGYKSNQDAKYWIVFKDEDINKAIRVEVAPATYYSSNKGDTVWFTLSARQLYWYGNTNEPEHLK